MTLVERLNQDLTAAMKARDAARTSTLRMAKAAIMNKEIDKKGALDDGEATKLLQGLVKQREDAEVAAAVDKAVSETGASSLKDMGKAMKAALAALAASGKAVDGKRVNEAVKKKLGG